LTINLVAAVTALLGAVFVGESPLHPMQLLWINLVIDLLGSISLILEKPQVKDLNSKPYSRREKLLTSDMSKMIVCESTIQVAVLSFIMFSSPEVFGYVSSVGVEEWNK
jgi:magnesium-transporting ATPase (P-type)